VSDTPDQRASITGVTPSWCAPEGGAPIRITGSGFVTPGVRTVKIGGQPVPWFRVVDDATLETFAPGGKVGPTHVEVQIGVGGFWRVPFSYVVQGGSPFVDRGRWRLTLHQRSYADQAPTATILADLIDARGRRLSQKWNTPAELTFTLDANSSQAPLVRELVTDVYAWRWDEAQGKDVAVFRGLVDHSEDQYDSDSGVVTFVCHDYLAMMQRRVWTAAYSVTQRDQDDLAWDIILNAMAISPSVGSSFGASSYLPLMPWWANPDGTTRPTRSGRLRDRNYLGNTVHGVAFDELAKVDNGFDYDVVPMTDGSRDRVRIFYPSQGVTRAITFAYGAQLDGFTRTVACDEYANYQRLLGNNQTEDPGASQVYAEAWNSDAANIAPNGIGLWMRGDQASDVTITSTLQQQAAGSLNLSGVIVPTYTVSLVPGVYRWGSPNMGDTIGLVIAAGRLNVNTTARVVGIDYDIGDDGQEDVKLTLGRSPLALHDLLVAARVDIDALARR
jgi:IPT/TIG domain